MYQLLGTEKNEHRSGCSWEVNKRISRCFSTLKGLSVRDDRKTKALFQKTWIKS